MGCRPAVDPRPRRRNQGGEHEPGGRRVADRPATTSRPAHGQDLAAGPSGPQDARAPSRQPRENGVVGNRRLSHNALPERLLDVTQRRVWASSCSIVSVGRNSQRRSTPRTSLTLTLPLTSAGSSRTGCRVSPTRRLGHACGARAGPPAERDGTLNGCDEERTREPPQSKSRPGPVVRCVSHGHSAAAERRPVRFRRVGFVRVMGRHSVFGEGGSTVGFRPSSEAGVPSGPTWRPALSGFQTADPSMPRNVWRGASVRTAQLP